MDVIEDSRPTTRSVQGTAGELGCSESHVRLLIRTGQLKAKKSGSRVLVTQAEIDRYIDSLPDWQPGAAPEAAVAARRK